MPLKIFLVFCGIFLSSNFATDPPIQPSATTLYTNSSVNWSFVSLNKSFWGANIPRSGGVVFGVKPSKGWQRHSDKNTLPPVNEEDPDSVHEDGLLKALGSRYGALGMPFNPARSAAVSQKCRQQTAKYFSGLKNFDMWAIRMLDSSAKLPSGLLNGNVNQLGDFDQCLDVLDVAEKIRGQYCLASLQPEVPDKYVRMKFLHQLLQSHSAFRSEFNDPGHRVPRFSTINWALCVPSGCSHTDIELSLLEYAKEFTAATKIDLKVRIDKEMCQTKQTLPRIDQSTLIAGGVFLVVLLLAALMTLYDFKSTSENKNEWFLTFSLRKNTQSLFSFTRDSNDIASVHGIRFFNAVMLIIAHKSMALFFGPYSNRTEMSEYLGQPWTVIGRAASLYTDPFIMLSGLLTTYSLYGRLQRGQPIRVVQEYAGRFLRLVPTLGALILFCTFILPLLGTGPQWNLVITTHADICKTTWWRNLLFIHNYFGFENMCLTHTHHVGIDTQLFILSPLIAVGLFKWPRKTLMTILAIAGISTAARYHVTVTRRLANYIFFGTSISQLFDTANYMYILPAHRATVYAMGVLLGYVLRRYRDLTLTPTQLKVGWYINTALMLVAFFGPAPMGSIGYEYNATHAAHYAAFAPIAWCSFFAWIIFTSHLGYESLLSRLLSWEGFLVTTRLSYAIYLTQFPVFFYNVGRTRTPERYEFIPSTLRFNEFLWIALTSIALTLLFDTPFGNIKKLLFRAPSRRRGSAVPDKNQQEKKEIVYSTNVIKSLLD
ncbi:nose resistant to fluoxetine protein 6-like [Lutzomyia longipalpis]|uniref:nose resistant to fluoxetine protein 6-like n=1 Tax=Lutzomyia longipalpis TaxID=7200 RepID=UPI00248417CA|nr:nose resistant to fluoxetine protein 6-like [Lutzomyia longipalpis]